MPPRGHSSSSHSSRSHSSHSHSSSSHSSRSHSSYHSHSSSSHSSYSSSGSGYSSYMRTLGYQKVPSGYRKAVSSRLYIPSSAPSNIKQSSIHLHCKNHKYLYYPEGWTDTATGKCYNKGYYDENDQYYSAEEITFRRTDGTFIAAFKCEYCGNTAEYEWKEGQSPSCNKCGAVMTRVPTYIDDIVEVTKADVYTGYEEQRAAIQKTGIRIAKIIAFSILFLFLLGIFLVATGLDKIIEKDNKSGSNKTKTVSNVDIYGRDLYLNKLDNNTYEICDETDDYEKHLTWDYGQDSYYDRESDCYVWYNTDVSPNLWQYWYEEISGSNKYGWMEYENGSWYIERSEGDWKPYNSDTSKLWHILNEFD